ncbi:unnamed protein product [Hanseniaspora opuntiae]
MNHLNIESFFDSIDAWRANTYQKFDDLSSINTAKKSIVKPSTDKEEIIILDSDIESEKEDEIIEVTTPVLNKNQQMLINEMLLNPNLLKNIFELKFIFMNIIDKVPDFLAENEIIKNNITPMVINQFFITNDPNHWSYKWINDLINSDFKLGENNCQIISANLLEIILQSTRLATLLISPKDYYFKMSCILRLLSNQQIQEISNIRQLKSIVKQYPEYKPFMVQLVHDLNVGSPSKAEYIHLILRTMNLVFSAYEKDSIWKNTLKDFNVNHFITILKESNSKAMLKERIIAAQHNHQRRHHKH